MSYVALGILRQLRQEDMHWMLAAAELKTIAANGILVREADSSETIFFIADGLFEVYVYGGSSKSVKVGQLGAGEIVGEISWLDRKPISATVRAVETSSVIALSIASLERKLAVDTGFAARLFRAIATLTAERLRTTTSKIYRVEMVGQNTARVESGTAAAMIGKIDELKRLIVAQDADAGPVREPAAGQIREAFAALEQVMHLEGVQDTDKLAARLQTELLPLVRLSATGERCFTKPRGYAGDYQTTEMIYNNVPTGTGRIGVVLDGCVLDLAAAKAIRNRRRLLASEILKSYAENAKECHVACLACGPASEIFDAFEKVADIGRLHVSCIDTDGEALSHVAARARAQKLGEQLRTYHGYLIYFAAGGQKYLAPQDLIYSLNLTDYFNDELAVTLINWIYDELRPGGRVILGNFHPRNPSRYLMGHLVDWHLVHRDEAAMNQLFLASKFAKPCSRIAFEDEGIYLLAECTR